MNRRDFLTVAGGVSAASILGASPLLAAEKTTPFYVRGLAMLSLNDPDYLRIGLPKAPHHRATLSVVPKADDRYAVAIRGNGELAGIRAAGGNPDLYLRDVVHVRELYKDAISLIDRSPSMISIPWTAIKSVETHSLSKERWTFVRRETEEEVISFRPRRIADSIKIELLSTSTLKMNDGTVSVPLSEATEVWTDFVPESDKVGDFTHHFQHYMPYVQTASAVEVEPKKLGARTERAQAMGNSFAPMVVPWPVCFLMILA